jgi:hypothetical protein
MGYFDDNEARLTGLDFRFPPLRRREAPLMALGVLTPTKGERIAAADDTGLRSELISIIKNFAANAPRSLQRSIGPSQVGTACPRELAYMLSDLEPTRDVHDPWPSIVGTAVHSWLADAMAAANPPPPADPIWIPERRVDVGFGLRGSSDVFHIPTGCVLDWKILGDTTYRQYTSAGPSEVYRTQAHCYGLGFARAGFQVARVGIVFMGRSKYLKDMFIWSEPWDPERALRALDRKIKIEEWLRRGNAPNTVPKVPGGSCYYCSFKSKNGGEDGYCVGKDGDG